MIPAQNLDAWGNVVSWTDPRQVEQDLDTGRALVVVFSNQVLRGALRVHGGTALSKLSFPAPMRFSEDIGLVRTSAGTIGPIFDALRGVREPNQRVRRLESRPSSSMRTTRLGSSEFQLHITRLRSPATVPAAKLRTCMPA